MYQYVDNDPITTVYCEASVIMLKPFFIMAMFVVVVCHAL